jgi:hypothetical protein
MLKSRSFFIFIYIEKEKVYNIEGQLRGLQGFNQVKTCAPKARSAATQVQKQKCRFALQMQDSRLRRENQVLRLERFCLQNLRFQPQRA